MLRSDGSLEGMDNEDIAIAADYDGDADEFVQVLAELRLIDGGPGEYRIHDFEEHQPWIAGAKRRSDAARKAAESRWSDPKEDATRTSADSAAHNEPVQAAPKGSAPRSEPHAPRINPQCPVSDSDSVSETDPSPNPTHRALRPVANSPPGRGLTATEVINRAVKLVVRSDGRPALRQLSLQDKRRAELKGWEPIPEHAVDRAVEATRHQAAVPNWGYFMSVLRNPETWRLGPPDTEPPKRDPESEAYERAAIDAGLPPDRQAFVELRKLGVKPDRLPALQARVESHEWADVLRGAKENQAG